MAPLIVIVGQTASGKSEAALKLAEIINGEIICADSRTVYKGMDIGTAKPTKADQKHVPHHLLDIVEPDEKFTVADFKRLAEKAIDDISNRSKVPILVGGSGLYINSVIFGYQFSSKGSERDEQNPRHLKRSGDFIPNQKLRSNTLIFGLQLPEEVIKKRIAERVDKMIKHGLVEEVGRLGKRYGWATPALQAPGYKAFRSYVLGEIDLEQAKSLFIKNDLDLAKRQRTWFKRNKRIQWQNDPNKIVDIATTELNKLR